MLAYTVVSQLQSHTSVSWMYTYKHIKHIDTASVRSVVLLRSLANDR
jgi:hypothetical protein